MKTGDLVTLREWCKNSGKIAIISENVSQYSCIQIMFIDELKFVWARKENLVLLEAK